MSIEINTGIQKVSALPEVEGDGKALVSVNGEWVEQIGYGYKTIEALIDQDINVVNGYNPAPKENITKELVESKEYVVTFDGVKYPPLTAIKYKYFVQFGDTNLVEYPFFVQCMGTMLNFHATDGTHSLKIETECIVPMEEAYAPNINNNIRNGEGKNSVQCGSAASATGVNSVAIGAECEASGSYTHAEGANCKASGDCSAAFGAYTTAKSMEFVVGEYNKESPDYPTDRNKRTLFIVGGGSDSSHRKNALAVDMQGGIVVPASDNQNKFFRITVNSSGVISATEVTE